MPRRTRLALLGGLLAVATVAGSLSLRRLHDQLAVLEACEAVAEQDWARVLAGTEGRVAAGSEEGRAAAECRCLALLASDRGDACVALLDEILADPDAGDWAPDPALAVHWIQTRRDAGRTADAAALARRAGRAHPQDPDLFYLELVTRAGVEDEGALLREMRTRLPDDGPAAVRMRVSLANRHLLRGDAESALAVLGASPPGEPAGLWYDTRGMAFATAGDVAAVRRSFAEWRRAGGNPDELLARYALTLSIAGLRDPDRPPIELLGRGLDAAAELGDPKLEEALTIRWVLTLVDADLHEEALRAYDRGREQFELAGLSRAELERSAEQHRLAALPAGARRGTLVFQLAGARGGTLHVSPEPSEPVDADYAALAVPDSGRVEVTRALGEAPLRWVYRDAAGRARASGSVTPRVASTVSVRIEPGEPAAAGPPRAQRRAADGRRRVALLLLDCGDWRIVQYLRTRGELPVIDALIRSGHRAVLESDPPLTAAALEALVFPRRAESPSFLGLLHRLGLELAGLESVGENPLEALAWWLPEQRDFFSVAGAGPRSVANLLLAHGGIRAGRHSEVTGPRGERRRVPLATSARDLSAEERLRWPALGAVRAERDAVHLRTIAAELDTAEELVRAGEVDLFALRVEPLDILTHAHFADAVRDGADDGVGLLFSVYRYLDARIGAVDALLDTDDVLVVMSDHGIRTAMEHSREAIFVAVGDGVPRGRAPGRPALRGVPAVLAALLDVPAADWPRTGVAPWAVAGSAAPGPVARLE